MNKDKIKNLILVMIVAVISGSLSSILTTNTISTNKLLGSVSHSDYLDSSNVTYSDSNVQDSIDNLYTQANDYSSINNRLSNIEGYFQNNPTSYFDGSVLRLGKNSEGYGNSLYYYNKSHRGSVYAISNGLEIAARDENETPRNGTLALYGNPVKINSTDFSTLTTTEEIYNDHFKGMSVVIEKIGNVVQCRISGELSETLNSSNNYETIYTLPTTARPKVSQINYILYNANLEGQFNVYTDGTIKLGYTRKVDAPTTNVSVSSGNKIYGNITWITK